MKNLKLAALNVLNFLFAVAWFTLKRLIPRKFGDGTELKHYAPRMIAQLLLARLFGGATLIFLGDSNSECFSNYRDVRRFKRFGVVVTLGVSGSTAQQWASLLHSGNWMAVAVSKLLHLQGNDVVICMSAGGNDVLRSQGNTDGFLSQVRTHLISLRSALSGLQVCAVLIPPVHLSMLEAVGYRSAILKRKIEGVNEILRAKFSYIDTYHALQGPCGEAYPGALSDPVHYSQASKNIIADLLHAMFRRD